jgi:K+-transporting ATPase ATPase A chain
MNTEMIGIIVSFIITVAIAFPLGKYIAKVFKGEKTFTDFLNPIERLIFRFCGIDPKQEMTWKQHLVALLSINMIWFVYAFVVLIFQGSLFLNPDGNPSMSPDLSFNTTISFLVNCNLQRYNK